MTGTTESGDPFERLRQAQEALEEFESRGAHAEDVADFLDEHDHLRDLLEPMLEADQEGDDEHVIGDFRVVRELGRGGMGIVYEARQLSLNRPVALKLLSHERSSHPASVARFRREATLAAGLEHPSIAKVYGFTEDEHGHYLAMELVHGTPLDEVIRGLAPRRDRLDGREVRDFVAGASGVDPIEDAVWDGSYEHVAVRLTSQLADALEHAHAAGVIHRDVKPGNVLVRPDGRAVLTDFGLARETGLDGVTLTGEVAGTPAYQSPEQIESRAQELGPSTDVFSLGATLYELLTFERAFDGETILEVQQRVLRHEPRHPTKANARIDRDLAAITLRALEKNPKARYPSAGSFAEDLRAWLEARPVQARTASMPRRLARWCARNPLAASFNGVLLVSIAALAWSESRTRKNLDQFEWLAGGVRVQSLMREYESAPPAWPQHVGAYDALLDEARLLVADLPKAQANVREVRERGATDADGSVTFTRVEDEFLFEGTSRGVRELEDIRDGMIPGLEARRAWALEVAKHTVDAHRDAWDQAIASIRAEHGIELAPQIGLVPLHRSEQSGLWEFWHVKSGARPEIVDGRVRVGEDTGLVLVLVPPCAFWMGAQADDATQPNFDEDARTRDRPVHRVAIERPFFLSKYEMTHGQWKRLLDAGEEPAAPDAHPAEPFDGVGRYPIEDESQRRGLQVLRRYGLTLPTEAQWEACCRAGSESRWSAGGEIADLHGFANVRDAALEAKRDRIMVRKWPPYAPFDDGFARQAPVDAFAPNPWGFHQMHGNVRELCRDTFHRSYDDVSHDAADGAISGAGAIPGIVVVRGGYYAGELLKTGSGIRFAGPAADRNKGVGMRPARAVW